MKKIGIVSCDEWIYKIKEDLMLQENLVKQGYVVDIISWQDNKINYLEYSHLILRSVWGYQDYYQEFKNWLTFIKENNISLYNNVNLVMNNIRKDVQFGILDEYNIPHISTHFIHKKEELLNPVDINGNAVVKPIISGSGNNTYMFDYNKGIIDFRGLDKEIFDKLLAIIDQPDNGLMIQPYINGIVNGEYSCIFIGGENTHNMLRFPGIFSHKRKPIYLEMIPKDVYTLANTVANIPEFKDYLYMRVDIVIENNKPYIMEVELAEPDLMIKYVDDGLVQHQILDAFVKKLERKL